MTLQNKSLMLKVNAKPQLIESSKNKTFKIVLGSKVRSKTGCLNCRKRKYVYQHNIPLRSIGDQLTFIS